MDALIKRLRIYLEQLSHEAIGAKQFEYPLIGCLGRTRRKKILESNTGIGYLHHGIENVSFPNRGALLPKST